MRVGEAFVVGEHRPGGCSSSETVRIAGPEDASSAGRKDSVLLVGEDADKISPNATWGDFSLLTAGGGWGSTHSMLRFFGECVIRLLDYPG